MTQFYRHTPPIFPETRQIRGPFFAESNQKSGVGWHWWEEETVFKSHIAPLNVLHDLHPENPGTTLIQAQETFQEGRGKQRLGGGSSPGRMLGHSPDLPMSWFSFKRQHRK